jgi:mRNA interferase MazF
MSFIKNFLQWFALKPKLDDISAKPPLIEEANFWWCSLGENVGTEISGKGQKFARPCIIYKKLSPFTFMIIPCSTQIKEGSWFFKFSHNDIEQIAVLSQARIIDYRRLKNKIGTLDEKDFNDISDAFIKLYTVKKITKKKSLPNK